MEAIKFNIRNEKDAKKLPEEQSVHSIMLWCNNCLFVTEHIQTAVAFLSTMVKCPDENDWGKLKRVKKHLNGMQNSELRLTGSSI